jgi:hypothetical protein
VLLARGARVCIVEALLLADDARLEALLTADAAPGAAALLTPVPNDGALLTFARTPFAVERLLALGVSADARDRWGTAPIDAFSKLGARGLPLVRLLVERGVAAPTEVHARLGDLAALERAAAQPPASVLTDDVILAAVDARQHDVVAWLLARGASANAARGRRRPARARRGARLDARGWAETSLEITRNPAAGLVAAYLASIGE